MSNFGIYQKLLYCDNETKTIDIYTTYVNLLQEERYEHIKELYNLYEAYNSYKHIKILHRCLVNLLIFLFKNIKNN